MMIIIVLLLMMLVFVLWPVFSQRNESMSQEAENLRLYRQSKEEINASEHTDDEKKQMILELDHELISNEADIQGFKSASKKQRFITAALLFSIMTSSVLFLYDDLGAQEELVATHLLDKLSKGDLSDEERFILKDNLKSISEGSLKNYEWQYLYASMLFAEGQYTDSATAFENLLESLPEDANANGDRAATLLQIAESKFYGSNQQASEEIYDYLTRSLELEPMSPKVLSLAGIIAFELNHLEAAFDHWKTLWLNISGSSDAKILEQGIKRIASDLEEQGKVVDLSWLKQTEVKIWVSVSDELKAQLQPTDTVFVLAKALTGPVMPLAAVKIMAKDLPTEIILDDSSSMMPSLSLSKFEEVQVIARISKSGEPIASSGDFQGVAKSVLVKSGETVQLEIDTVVE